MQHKVWHSRYFLEAQGYSVTNSSIYQDNHSVMLLEKNGHGSSIKRTHHINIRYFFVADRIADGEVKVEYCCPTGDMLADFFTTKRLQGSTFRKFCNEILNINGDPVNYKRRGHRSVLNNQSGTKKHVTKIKSKLQDKITLVND
jgi:hypothetical protein